MCEKGFFSSLKLLPKFLKAIFTDTEVTNLHIVYHAHLEETLVGDIQHHSALSAGSS